MKINHIVVMINTRGTDEVYVHTDLPCPFPKEVSEQNLSLRAEVQAGKGIEYVQVNFPGETIHVLDYRTGKTTGL